MALYFTDSMTGVFKDYTGVVFPADVRNCTVCHTDDRWKTKPSQLACTACHDSDSTRAHATLMTLNPNPSDPYDPG